METDFVLVILQVHRQTQRRCTSDRKQEFAYNGELANHEEIVRVTDVDSGLIS